MRTIARRGCDFQIRAGCCRGFDEVRVDVQEIRKALQRLGQIAKPGRDERLQLVIFDFLSFDSKQPAQVQHAQVASKQIGSQRQERVHPALSLVPIRLKFAGAEAQNHVLMRGQHPKIVAFAIRRAFAAA